MRRSAGKILVLMFCLAFLVGCNNKFKENISGTYKGNYQYNDTKMDVSFLIILNISNNGNVSGSVIENCNNNGTELGNAKIDGTFKNNTLNFTKTYIDADPNYSTVKYFGVYNPLKKEISGTWKVSNNSGTFKIINVKPGNIRYNAKTFKWWFSLNPY